MATSPAQHNAQVEQAALRLATFAARAGVPQSSMRRFALAGYAPQPKQLLFHAACRAADSAAAATAIGYGGARGGGKTHCAFAQITIDDCQRFPNLKVLFLRKVAKYARESIDDLRRAILPRVPHEFRNNVIHFGNGSRVMVGSYQYEKDIDNYLSLEYDVILIEQAEQLSGKKIDLISTVNRSSKGFRPRMYLTFNPAGLGHNYLKRRFIEPFRGERERETRFIFADFKDNLFLNAEYELTLNNLTGWQRAAWRDGDWDVASGQYFSTWRHDAHTYTPAVTPEIIGESESVWAAFDYGFTHPTACYLFSEFDSTKYVVSEYVARKRLPAQNAEEIKQMLARHGVEVSRLRSFVAGADVFAHKGSETGKTIADQYADCGIRFTPANTDRIAGAAEILKLLGDPDRDSPPVRLKISTACPRLINSLPALQHDPNRPEDVLKVNADDDGEGGDDEYDSFRYGVMEVQRQGIFL